jgi:long-chain acyl-CoA synthetase
VPRPGKQVDVDDLLSFARRELADFKLPQYVVVQDDELPRNPGGKVVKPTLRERIDWSGSGVAAGRRG